MAEEADRDRVDYWAARAWMSSAVHELPAGVLDGHDGATESGCRAMLNELEQFDRLCRRLGLEDHQDFIEGCRWHFEHYGHYLSRRRHFVDYETYTRDRNGPLRVSDPPAPPRWLAQGHG